MFPLIGLIVCIAFLFMMIRMLGAGHGVMCTGGHRPVAADEIADLRREIQQLRDELRQSRTGA